MELVELILGYQTNLLRVKVHCTQLLGLRHLGTLRAIGLALLTLAILVLWVRSDKLWILPLVLPVQLLIPDGLHKLIVVYRRTLMFLRDRTRSINVSIVLCCA